MITVGEKPIKKHTKKQDEVKTYQKLSKQKKKDGSKRNKKKREIQNYHKTNNGNNVFTHQ